jgi:hypothetical protein
VNVEDRPVSRSTPGSGSPRAELTALRTPLIELHRALLDAERRAYESAHGRVSAAELLQLALSDPQFAWLHQISTIIVRADELIAAAEPPAAAEVGVLSAHIRALLRPDSDGSDFERRYHRAIQDDPAVLLGHRAVMQALPPDRGPAPPTVH